MVDEGVDFVGIDKVMEKQFGWPMGPAYLSDVVGIDTADHCTVVMEAGFPTRMKRDESSAIAKLAAAERYGQKTAKASMFTAPTKRKANQRSGSCHLRAIRL